MSTQETHTSIRSKPNKATNKKMRNERRFKQRFT